MEVLAKTNYLDPYIIAMMGRNHDAEVGRAKQMIEQAAEAGAHAAKFLHAAEGEPAENFAILANHAARCGIDFLSSPNDLEALDIVAPLSPYITIAPSSITDLPLLRAVGKVKKPAFLSTGDAVEANIAYAIDVLEEAGCPAIVLQHCVSANDSAAKAEAQLSQIGVLEAHFGARCQIGYADHTAPDADGGLPALEMAVILGAVVIEKHFTYDKSASGSDHKHSMDAADLKQFIVKIEQYRDLYGKGERNLAWEKDGLTQARRRICASQTIETGEALNESNVIALRGNIGIEIERWDEMMGRTAIRRITAGEPVMQSDLG